MSLNVWHRLSNQLRFWYRQITKLQSTYVLGLQDYILEDGKSIPVMCRSNSDRTSVISDPNLQNIPVRLEQGRLIRKAFVPSTEDAVLLSSIIQIELRVLAHISGDEHLIAAFKEGADIHTSTAMRVFGIEKPEDVTLTTVVTPRLLTSVSFMVFHLGLSNNSALAVRRPRSISTYLNVILVLRLMHG
ncbi:MAG: DNA polymerase [Streptococcus sp.]